MNKRVCGVVETAYRYVTSVSREASEWYQTRGMRNQCRSRVVWCGVWCVVSVDGRGWCCVGACVSPRRARARVSEQRFSCREQQRARRQHGNERETAQCRFTTSSLSQAGLAPADRQVGVGISLKRARTVGSRRLRIDELGQAIGCLCEDGYTVLL